MTLDEFKAVVEYVQSEFVKLCGLLACVGGTMVSLDLLPERYSHTVAGCTTILTAVVGYSLQRYRSPGTRTRMTDTQIGRFEQFQELERRRRQSPPTDEPPRPAA